MTVLIGLADRVVEIRSMYEEIYSWSGDFVLVNSDHLEPEIVVRSTPEDIRRELEISHGGTEKGALNESEVFPNSHLEVMAFHRKICEAMPAFDTFLMHGAVVAYEGRGYMFTAPSGTGKTTRALRWLEEFPGSIVVNGDKPLLKVTDDAVLAYGTPWCGKERMNTNTSVPMQAIFLVERAEDREENAVTELKQGEAFTVLLRQTYKPSDPEAMRKTLKLLQRLVRQVKVYRFRGSPTREAVRLAWETAQT